MAERAPEHFRRVDPQYYPEHGAEWANYAYAHPAEHTYQQSQMYAAQPDRMQYVQYDPNYVVYQNDQAMMYQAQPMEQYAMQYQGYANDQMRMAYAQQAYQAPMSYQAYPREVYYNQPRAMVPQAYVKPEMPEPNHGMHPNAPNPAFGYNMNYYQNMMYYNQMNAAQARPDMARPDMYADRNLDFMANKNIFKPSLTFKEAATAMLSMETKKAHHSRGGRGRGRGGVKHAAKAQRTPSEQSDASHQTAREGHYTPASDESYRTKRTLEQPAQTQEREEPPRQLREYRAMAAENARFRNRGLEQLSQYGIQFSPAPSAYSKKSQSSGHQSVSYPAAAAGYGHQAAQKGPPPSHQQSQAHQQASRATKDWQASKRVMHGPPPPGPRFYPATPKAIANVRAAEAAVPKMNVVEEITIENDIIQGLRKNAISSAAALMESFQQSFSNKRKRVKNCLVEDCRHMIGEQPKIDVQFGSVELAGEKKYLLSEVVATLLPYHLFYYEEVQPPKAETFDYADVALEIDSLERDVTRTLMAGADSKLADGYTCVKEGLITCSELLFNYGHER